MRHKGSPNLPEKAQRRAKRLVDLYEREAYKTYNLALRTTGEPQAAAHATEVAFLRYVASTASASDADTVAEQRAALLKEAVVAAVAEAPAPTARSKRKGRSDAEKLLAANAALSGPERAAIALISIDEGAAEAIAAATETTQKAAAALAKQAQKNFADRSGIAAGKLAAALHDWPWVEPPAEIWEGLYPQAERLLAEVDAVPAKKAKPAKSARRPSPAARRAVRSTGAGAMRRKGLSDATRVWAFRAAVLVIVLLPAAVVAMTGESGDSGTSAALSAVSGGSGSTSAASGENTEGGSTYDALSPKELDQLRLEELEDLRAYSRAQADKSLSSSEQADAEAEAQALLELARQRLEEAEQREQQAAAREEQAKANETPAPPATTPAQPAPGKKKKGKKKRKPAPPSGVSIDDCLFDEESGTYICPE